MNLKLSLLLPVFLVFPGLAMALPAGTAPVAPSTLLNVSREPAPEPGDSPGATSDGGESDDPIAAVLTSANSDAAPTLQVDLRLAERIALEQNLGLKAQTYDLLAGVAAERKSHGIYDPLFSLTLAQGSAKEEVNSAFFVVGGVKNSQDYRQFDAGVNQQLFTGGQLGLDFTNERTSSAPPPAINPAYASEFKLSLTQPLLKNFGRTVTEQGILFAIKDRQRSVQDLRNQAFTLLSDVRDAYYEVLRSRDELAYRKTSLELAQRVLKENRARVDAGVMAPIDILEAEVGVKQREGDLLDAQRQHQDALDNLALLLNTRQPLRAGDEPLEVTPLATDAEAGLETALVGRPDIQQQLRDIERLQIEQAVARNQRLPALDLLASYSSKGLGKDYGDDWDDISSDRYPNWQVGVALSYPLGNRAARNEVLRNRVRAKGLEARLNQLQEEVRTQIRAAIRLLDVSRKKVEISSRGRDLAAEKLRTLLKRKEVGLATTRDVLQGEDDLALARTTEISSLAGYNNAVTAYLRVTGQLLDREGVYFTGKLDPESDARLLQMANP
jgi:outer membrane protein